MELRKRAIIVLLFIACAIFLFQTVVEYNDQAYRLYARQGVLDITGLELDNDDKYLLSGDWEIYDGVLLSPEEIENFSGSRTFLLDNRNSLNPNIHNRTYRLKIITKDTDNIGILIPDISAFRLWVNGSAVLNYRLENENSKILRMNTVILNEEMYKTVPDGYELEMVLEVQDRISYRERPFKVMIGRPSALINTENINLVLNTLTIGCYILVVIYSFTLYRKKRSEVYLLYLGLLALNNILANLLDSNILSVFPVLNIRADWWIKLINMATLFIPIFVFMVCNKLFYGSISGRWQKIFLTVSSSLTIIIALLPLEISIGMGNLSLYIVRIIVPVNTFLIIAAYLQRRCNTIMLAGGILFAAAFILEVSINTGINEVGIISVYINTSQYAYLVFTIIVVLTVANKFAKKFDEAEKLSGQLEYMNKNLEIMVDEKTKELKDSYNQILELENKRHNLFLNISHDLRSPLFVIKGYMEAINGGMVRDESSLTQYLKRMQIKTEYLGRLIEDLFLVARLEDNMITFSMVEFDLVSLIGQVSRDIEVKALTKNISIYFHPSVEQLKIEGDKHRIQQVIDNVINNAVKFTGENGSIDIYLMEKNNKDALVKIKDNGIGISKEDLCNIFERYYKGMKRGGDDESTGLGLFISREIVEKHGGKIWAESEIGKGTCIFIELPISSGI